MTAVDGGTMRPRQRPRVVCHMLASVDGRIVTDAWLLSAAGRRQYELVHATYAADAREYVGPPREDFVAPGDSDAFAFAVDPRERLL